jgi:hypothetical protein
VVENESIFRRANEQLEKRFRDLEAKGLTPFLCECGDAACTHAIRLTLDEYEAVRTHGAHFAILPGHQILEAERVVAENGRYDVVEKTDAGRRVAEARDPRQSLRHLSEPEDERAPSGSGDLPRRGEGRRWA